MWNNCCFRFSYNKITKHNSQSRVCAISQLKHSGPNTASIFISDEIRIFVFQFLSRFELEHTCVLVCDAWYRQIINARRRLPLVPGMVCLGIEHFFVHSREEVVNNLVNPTQLECGREQVIKEYTQLPLPFLEHHSKPYHVFDIPEQRGSSICSAMLICTGKRLEESGMQSPAIHEEPSSNDNQDNLQQEYSQLSANMVLHLNTPPVRVNEKNARSFVGRPIRWLSKQCGSRPKPTEITAADLSEHDSITYYLYKVYCFRKLPTYYLIRLFLSDDISAIYTSLLQIIPHHSAETLRLFALPLTSALLGALSRLFEENGVIGARHLTIECCSLVSGLAAHLDLLYLLNRVFPNVENFNFLSNSGLHEGDAFLDSLLSTKALFRARHVYIELDELHSSAQFSTEALISYILGTSNNSPATPSQRLTLVADWCHLDANFLEELIMRFIATPVEDLLPINYTLIRMAGLFQHSSIPQYDYDTLSKAVTEGCSKVEATSTSQITASASLRQICTNEPFSRNCYGKPHPSIPSRNGQCKGTRYYYENLTQACTKTAYRLRHPSTANETKSLTLFIEVVVVSLEDNEWQRLNGVGVTRQKWYNKKHQYSNDLSISFEAS